MRILDQRRCSVSNLNRHMLTEQLGPVLVVREREKEGKGELIITPPAFMSGVMLKTVVNSRYSQCVLQ